MQPLQLNCIAYINVKFVGLVLVIREKEELENYGRDHWVQVTLSHRKTHPEPEVRHSSILCNWSRSSAVAFWALASTSPVNIISGD